MPCKIIRLLWRSTSAAKQNVKNGQQRRSRSLSLLTYRSTFRGASLPRALLLAILNILCPLKQLKYDL